MEPGLRDREYGRPETSAPPPDRLQWSPVLETGNTSHHHSHDGAATAAAMEPGLRDREYQPPRFRYRFVTVWLQWSPVLETGNTVAYDATYTQHVRLQWSPVLETGNTRLALEDYPKTIELQWSPVLETGNTRPRLRNGRPLQAAAMEPGLRDREYMPRGVSHAQPRSSCNGARS